MSNAPGEASLLDVDLMLACSLGPHATAEIGRLPILPVFAFAAGPWEPPPRSALGPGTLALVVLDGLLAAGLPPTVFGPRDVLEPWESRAAWTICAPARLAVIGDHFMEALRAWPEAASRLLARSDAGPPGDAPVAVGDERMLALLWRIAGRWGMPDGTAVALPEEVDARVLALACHVDEREVAAVLESLAAQGELIRPDRHGWLVRAPATTSVVSGHSRARRDELRARGTRQLAIARLACLDYVSLSGELQALLASRRRGAT